MAWAIIDKEDVPTLETFFQVVKEHVPAATVNTLMTDDGKTITPPQIFIIKQ